MSEAPTDDYRCNVILVNMDQNKLDCVKKHVTEVMEQQKLQDDFKQWAKIYLGRVKTFADLDNYVVERNKWILSDNKIVNESLKCVLQDRFLKDCKDRLLLTCQVCGRMFETASLCTRCTNSHLGGIFRCSCGRAYNYVGNLSRHRRNCH
jgi:hypothetical protein